MDFITLCTNGKRINILHYTVYLFSGSCIWSVVEQRVYQERIQNTDKLRQRLLTVWNELEQQIIDNAVDQWRDRLAACVREEGGHFEHTL